MLLVAAIYAWTTHRLSLPLVIMAVAIGAMEAWLRAPQALLPREGLAVGDDRSAFPRCHWGDGGMAPARGATTMTRMRRPASPSHGSGRACSCHASIVWNSTSSANMATKWSSLDALSPSCVPGPRSWLGPTACRGLPSCFTMRWGYYLGHALQIGRLLPQTHKIAATREVRSPMMIAWCRQEEKGKQR